jgi:hypothetical protein
MKLTKTQIEILTEAKAGTFGRVAVLTGVKLGGARPRSFGGRRRAAVDGLRDLGLVVFVASVRDVDTGYGASTTHFYESIWNITDAGRFAVEG